MIPLHIERKIDQAITDYEFLLAAGDAPAPSPPDQSVKLKPKDDPPASASPR